MSWRHFGDLRSALAAHDWQRVAVLMDERGGCEDETARFYAHEHLMALPDHMRPFRIAVGAGKVGRRSLISQASADIAWSMMRKRVYGGSFVLAPLYGFTSLLKQRAQNHRWEGWNTEPVPMRTPLGAARLDVLLTAYRGDWTPTGIDGTYSHTALIAEAVKSICLMRGIGDDNHNAEGAILRHLLELGHPRISKGGRRLSDLSLDGESAEWMPVWRRAATEILVSTVGNEIACAVRFKAAGQWYAGAAHDDDVRVLIERGHLRAHILRAAGVWLVPSPSVDGHPVRVEVDRQGSLLRIAKEVSDQAAPSKAARNKAAQQDSAGQSSLFGGM
jgi:hypothetical protein